MTAGCHGAGWPASLDESPKLASSSTSGAARTTHDAARVAECEPCRRQVVTLAVTLEHTAVIIELDIQQVRPLLHGEDVPWKVDVLYKKCRIFLTCIQRAR